MAAKMKLADIDRCFELLSQRQPDPQTELHFTDPYTLLVAVVLSAQATDVGVNRATKGLFGGQHTGGNGCTWRGWHQPSYPHHRFI